MAIAHEKGCGRARLDGWRQDHEAVTLSHPINKLTKGHHHGTSLEVHPFLDAPRVLSSASPCSSSLFALDVFGEGRGFWETTLALFMHLIPTWIVLAVLAISWRWGWVGALRCLALGAFYLISSWGRFHWSAYVLISGSLFLIGSLYLIDWLYRARLRAT